jgi:hypothetical protein
VNWTTLIVGRSIQRVGVQALKKSMVVPIVHWDTDNDRALDVGGTDVGGTDGTTTIALTTTRFLLSGGVSTTVRLDVEQNQLVRVACHVGR